MQEPSADFLLAQSDWIRALARRLVADWAEAEDLVQDTYVKALDRPPRAGSDPRSVRAWLKRVLVNAAHDRQRRGAQRRAREAVSAREESVPADQEKLLDRAATSKRLIDAVQALPEPGRSTVILRFYEGLSSAEIARQSGESHAAVRKRLERALAQLRSTLDAEYGGDRRAWCLALAATYPGVPGQVALTPIAILLMSTKLKIAAGLALVGLSGFTVHQLTQPERERSPAQLAAAKTPALEVLPQLEQVSEQGPRSSASTQVQEQTAPAFTTSLPRVIEGTVRGAGRAPLEGARVSLRWLPVGLDPLQARTDADGSFRIELTALELVSVHADFQSTVSVVADTDGYLERRRSVKAPAPGGVTRANLVLKPGYECFGRVVDDQGRPTEAVLQWTGANDDAVNQVSTTSTGEYRFPLPRTQALTLAANTELGGTGVLGPIVLPEDADFELPDLVLARNGVIRGVLRTSGHEPNAEVLVEALHESLHSEGEWQGVRSRDFVGLHKDGGLQRAACRTDTDGHFELRGLRPGNYRVRTGPSGEELKIDHGWHEIGSSLQLFADHPRVHLTVFDPDGLRMVSTKVELHGDGWTHHTRTDHARGEYVDDLRPGRCTLVVSTDKGSLWSKELTVLPSDNWIVLEADLSFDSEQGTLRLGVPEGFSFGEPKMEAKVRRVLSADVDHLMQLPDTLETMSKEPLSLPAGDYLLTFGGRGWDPYRKVEQSFHVQVGQETELQLEPGPRAGRVIMQPTGAWVAALAPESKAKVTVTSSSGAEVRWLHWVRPNTRRGGLTEWSLCPIDADPAPSGPLDPGTYHLLLELEGYEPFERSATVQEGQETVVDVVLTPR